MKLVGTNATTIYDETNRLLNDQTLYLSMANLSNPYGDGTASKKIVDFPSTRRFQRYRILLSTTEGHP
ncbi:UDP-N-acetylglucosamine 2-epimerase [Acinetobacter soli]